MRTRSLRAAAWCALAMSVAPACAFSLDDVQTAGSGDDAAVPETGQKVDAGAAGGGKPDGGPRRGDAAVSDAGSTLPSGAGLCGACGSSADCASGGVCLAYDGGRSFCGTDCTRATCPAGYECATIPLSTTTTVHQCVPLSGSCR